MSLFPNPHLAHVDDKPVLWFGVEAITDRTGQIERSTLVAIVVSPQGRVGTAPLNDVVADVRWVPDLSIYDGLGRVGPGFLDLDDMVGEAPEPPPEPIVPEPTTIDEVKQAVVDTLADKPSEPVDYITTADGQKWDPLTNKPIDD